MLQSKRFEVWRRMGKLYLLEDQPPSGLGTSVSTTVQPVTDVDQLLADVLMPLEAFESIAAGWVTMLTIPDGERWLIHKIQIGRSAGDRSITQLRIAGQGATVLALPAFSAVSSFISAMDDVPIPMQGGMSLDVIFSGGTTDGTWTIRVLKQAWTVGVQGV